MPFCRYNFCLDLNLVLFSFWLSHELTVAPQVNVDILVSMELLELQVKMATRAPGDFQEQKARKELMGSLAFPVLPGKWVLLEVMA